MAGGFNIPFLGPPVLAFGVAEVFAGVGGMFFDRIETFTGGFDTASLYTGGADRMEGFSGGADRMETN